MKEYPKSISGYYRIPKKKRHVFTSFFGVGVELLPRSSGEVKEDCRNLMWQTRKRAGQCKVPVRMFPWGPPYEELRSKEWVDYTNILNTSTHTPHTCTTSTPWHYSHGWFVFNEDSVIRLDQRRKTKQNHTPHTQPCLKKTTTKKH